MRFSVLALVTLLFANVAAAQGEERGWVVGLGSAFAFEDFDDTAGIDIDDSSTSGAQLGYRLSSMFTVEGEVDYIRDFDGSFTGGSIDFGGWYAGVSTKFYPVATQLRPYLMAGLGLMDGEVNATLSGIGSASDDTTELALQLGAGMDLNLNENWTLELQGLYRLPRGDLKDFKFYTLGGYLRYRF